MAHTHSDEKSCELGRAVLRIEAKAIAALEARIDQRFAAACRVLLACEGRIVVLGMGKSGHIGNKIAATLASTGSPAFFVHPGEASHGDLGMITAKDVVLALSNSGETSEIMVILPLIKRLGVPLISLTGNPKSSLAQAATVHLDVSVAEEACPLGLAPTSSTTATLAMGDALAVALLEARGFTAEDFALTHPNGMLGRRLLLRVEDIMRTGDRIPCNQAGTKLRDALLEMSRKGMGMTTVLNAENQLLGIFTDGDLRRALDKGYDVHSTPIEDAMTTGCKTINANMLAVEALNIMETHKITVLLIVNEHNVPVGALHMHDLLQAGVA
jgi:arabinose-5-phosphate isomerase